MRFRSDLFLQNIVRQPRQNTDENAPLPAEVDVRSNPAAKAAKAGPSALLQGWRRGTALARRQLLAGGFALLAVAFTLTWLWRSVPGEKAAVSSGPPAAYLVVQHGSVQLVRDGRRRLAGDAEDLQVSDQLVLAENARAMLVQPSGQIVLSGPQRVRVASLSNPRGASRSGAAAEPITMALFEATDQLSRASLLASTRRDTALVIYSPIGETAYLNPLFLWKNEPGKTYELALTDEFDPAATRWHAAGVVPHELHEIPVQHRADYLACISPGWKRNRRELYPMPLRQRLPVLPIPLRHHEKRVPLDLQALVDQAYTTGRYDRLDYTVPTRPAVVGGRCRVG